jgi:hypothetical protein
MGARWNIAKALVLVVFCFLHPFGALAETSPSITLGTAGGAVVFPGSWETAPTVVGSTYKDGDAASFMRSEGTSYRQVNDEHFQLLTGALLVRANNKAVFVSQAWNKDKIITRVAPRAVAMVATFDHPFIMNLSKRCCGAVITYLPSAKTEGANRFNIETGQTISLVPAKSVDVEPASPDAKVVETSDGIILVKSHKADVTEPMRLIFK